MRGTLVPLEYNTPITYKIRELNLDHGSASPDVEGTIEMSANRITFNVCNKMEINYTKLENSYLET